LKAEIQCYKEDGGEKVQEEMSRGIKPLVDTFQLWNCSVRVAYAKLKAGV